MKFEQKRAYTKYNKHSYECMRTNGRQFIV